MVSLVGLAGFCLLSAVSADNDAPERASRPFYATRNGFVLGPDNRVVIPAALLGGGAFLLLADTVARNVIAPAELSVGVITAFCGAPFFIVLLRARSGAAQP